MTTFCWLPPLSCAIGRSGSSGLTSSRRSHVLRQHHVLAHGHRLDDGVRPALGGHERDTVPDRLHRASLRYGAVGDRDVAGAPAQAEEQLGEMLASRAIQPSHAEDLARLHVEADVLDVAAADVRDAQDAWSVGGSGRAAGHLLDFLAGDEPDERGLVDLGSRRVADLLAVTQDDNAVSDLEHLFEDVRDEENAGATGGYTKQKAW